MDHISLNMSFVHEKKKKNPSELSLGIGKLIAKTTLELLR